MNNRLFRFSTILLSGLVICCLISGILFRYASAESLTFAIIEADSKPYKWKEGDKNVGYYVDLLDEISQRTGLTLSLKPFPLQWVLYSLKHGKVDGTLGFF